MSHKRSRAQFEAELQAEQSPYVAFGTPLPAIDPEVRDDGSYVPIWKQEVTDERGRKRLHGAFTGGFSAGYFNTVGSKEGWTPATFVSSRTNRNKDAQTRKPEDFMDEEDLKEAEDAKKISTDASYTGLGSTENEVARKRTIMDVLKTTGDTIGTKLLRKMGWRDGQGIGPRIRRKARMDDGEQEAEQDEETHLFAPDNPPIISFKRKNDHKGIGFEGEEKLDSGSKLLKNVAADDEEEEEEDGDTLSLSVKLKSKPAKKNGGFGVGILNDNGSDEEDPYEIGPKISYNKTLGGDKKKKKKLLGNGSRRLTGNANPLLKDKPVYFSKRSSTSSLKHSSQKCHDGRPPLEGFVLSAAPPAQQESRYPPPSVPPDWTSSKVLSSSATPSSRDPYQSTSDLAKSSTHNPSSRASLLGETPLPGKSVFDYLTPAARERIASLTKNPNLPAAGSETLPSATPASLESLVPHLDATVAATALGRGVAGFIPYADNPAKLARYRAFLSYKANLRPDIPQMDEGVSREDWRKELEEFAHAATIFKPMTGLMASRFTSARTSSTPATDAREGLEKEDEQLLRKPSGKKADPAEEAARLGMFGLMTRSSGPFYPSRLLCKRFDVPVPAWTAEDVEQDNKGGSSGLGRKSAAAWGSSAPLSGYASRFSSGGVQAGTEEPPPQPPPPQPLVKRKDLLGKEDMDALAKEAGVEIPAPDDTAAVKVDPERNEALEAERPGEAVFKAIFGSDSEDD